LAPGERRSERRNDRRVVRKLTSPFSRFRGRQLATEAKAQIGRVEHRHLGLDAPLEAIELPKNTWYDRKNQKVNCNKKSVHLHAPVIEVRDGDLGLRVSPYPA
jgi:hypothetical protein